MRVIDSHSTAVALLAILATTALAAPGSNLRVANGDAIAGQIGAAGEVDAFRVELAAGAVFTASAKAAKGGASLRLQLADPAAAPVAEATGPKPKLSKPAIATSGVHTLTVAAEDAASSGGYTLVVSWKSATKAGLTVTVPAGGSTELPFSGEAGTTASFVVKPARGSAAVASLVELAGPDGFVRTLGPGGAATATLPALGDYTLRFKDGGGAGGALTASAKLVAPKAVKRKLDLTAAKAPADVVVLEAAIIGKTGGVLAAPPGALAGAGVLVPAGAAKKPLALLLGTAVGIESDADRSLQPAGPAVFLGPEGTTFPASAMATVTLPYDASLLGSGEVLKVLTRDAAGVVTEVANPRFRDAQPFVDFDAPHFSSFQVHVKAKEATVVARVFHEPSTVTEFYGWSVAATADWIAVGSPRLASASSVLSGAVFVHPITDGVVGAPVRIDPPSPKHGQGFGGDVAMQGDLLVVGQFRTDLALTDPGSVHVYRLVGGTWQLEQILSGDPSDDHVEFGRRVAIDGNRIAVGSPRQQGPFLGASAAAYVFRHDGASWVKETRITSDHNEGIDFGASIALSGTTMAVGALSDLYPIGSVRVVARDDATGQWVKWERLVGEEGRYGFGASVALSGDVLVVGADDANGGTEGRAAVYEGPPGSMQFVENLFGAGPMNAEFGFSCALSGDDLVVGANAHRHLYPGKAYAFHRKDGQFRRTATLRGQDIGLDDETHPALLGSDVAWAGARLVIGALGAPGGANANVGLGGAAFVVELE